MLEERITRTIGRYALGAIVIAVIAGTVQGTAAWLLGVPFALALGIIAGLLGLIPQVGATIAAVVLSLVALTQGVPQALIMLAVCIGYQQLENYVLQPTIQGRAADISGFFVIASVIVGAALLGVVGALIAVPLVASAQIVIRELTAERRAAVALAQAAHARAGRVVGPGSLATGGAGAAEHDLVLLHRVAETPGRALERALEAVVRERLDPAAVVADEVVMVVVTVAARRLEARDAVADVDPLDEPQGGERLERPVDARDADGAAGGADAVVDLLGREAAPLRVEELDDRPACAAAAEPGGAEAVERVIAPARHRPDDTDSHVCYARPHSWFRESFSSVWPVPRRWPRPAAVGRPTPARSLVAAFHPLAYAMRQVAPAGSEVRRPDAARRRAARPRAERPRRRAAARRGARRLRGRRLPARRRGRRPEP